MNLFIGSVVVNEGSEQKMLSAFLSSKLAFNYAGLSSFFYF